MSVLSSTELSAMLNRHDGSMLVWPTEYIQKYLFVTHGKLRFV